MPLHNGGSGYTGHYIVVCGYDPTEGDFLCRDPASHRRDLIISAEALDAARMSFGTDEDLLLVRNAALDQRRVQAERVYSHLDLSLNSSGLRNFETFATSEKHVFASVEP